MSTVACDNFVIATVHSVWGDAFSTPKMRGFAHLFISLFLYNNNCFIDGKMVEWSHQIGKKLQVWHNNFKQQYKMMVSKYSVRRFALMYVINGGKWGNRLQYQLGPAIQNLKHPLKSNFKHPLLTKWLFPTASQSSPKIEITIKKYKTYFL